MILANKYFRRVASNHFLFSKAVKGGVEVGEPMGRLGRSSINSLKVGIVGMANVGKSSTFNLLSELSVPSENYPFCTIDPN